MELKGLLIYKHSILVWCAQANFGHFFLLCRGHALKYCMLCWTSGRSSIDRLRSVKHESRTAGSCCRSHPLETHWPSSLQTTKGIAFYDSLSYSLLLRHRVFDRSRAGAESLSRRIRILYMLSEHEMLHNTRRSWVTCLSLGIVDGFSISSLLVMTDTKNTSCNLINTFCAQIMSQNGPSLDSMIPRF